MKFKDLYDLGKTVQEVLEENELCRASDDELYIEICNRYISQNGMFIDEIGFGMFIDEIGFVEFMKNYRKWGFPTLESVGRTRRKVMEMHPELKPLEAVQNNRKATAQVFHDYSQA